MSVALTLSLATSGHLQMCEMACGAHHVTYALAALLNCLVLQ